MDSERLEIQIIIQALKNRIMFLEEENSSLRAEIVRLTGNRLGGSLIFGKSFGNCAIQLAAKRSLDVLNKEVVS